jgi:hypothetical protein
MVGERAYVCGMMGLAGGPVLLASRVPHAFVPLWKKLSDIHLYVP